MANIQKKTNTTRQLLNSHTQRNPEEATEDYLETINSLIHEKGFAASVDVAERMKVSKPTVTSIVKKLHKQGYLVHEKYRGMKLTYRGKKLAEEMQKKHQLITSFLVLFGVEEKVAREDAERIEHGLHPETLEKLRAFTEYIISNPELLRKYRASTS
ncbi:MAG: MarR family transcriptional regulator [Thaumarchaeota archaeon]|nr:MarR family transcriptional regulator [Nitrososphaerota archaeon]